MREEINCSELSFSRIVEIIVGTHAVHTSVENLFNLLNEVCAADVQNMVAIGTVLTFSCETGKVWVPRLSCFRKFFEQYDLN